MLAWFYSKSGIQHVDAPVYTSQVSYAFHSPRYLRCDTQTRENLMEFILGHNELTLMLRTEICKGGLVTRLRDITIQLQFEDEFELVKTISRWN